jgi:hypothetical protein
VVAFLVDLSTDDAFWTPPHLHSKAAGSKLAKMRFNRGNRLADTAAGLKAMAESWHANFSPTNILSEVPHLHPLFARLSEMIDCGDKLMPIGDEDNSSVKQIYRHVVQLRLVLGLPVMEIIPLDDWYIRNAALCENELVLCHSVFSELMRYLKTYYEEAIDRLKKRLQMVEARFENRDVINYFRLGPLGAAPANVIWIQLPDDRSHFVARLSRQDGGEDRQTDEARGVNTEEGNVLDIRCESIPRAARHAQAQVELLSARTKN